MPHPHTEIANRNQLHFSWLLKLRWSSILGQCATIFGVYWLYALKVPLLPLACLIAIEALSNLGFSIWLSRRPNVSEIHLAAVMALDIALLTGLLYFTGGPSNPFSFLYLVNIALAAVVLRAMWTWALVCLALGAVGILPLTDYRELPTAGLSPDAQAQLLQHGSWVAFGVAATFIVHFLWRVTKALASRERELNEAQARAARQDRLASLATMAAGAAHELATPLGTIALIAGELERSAKDADQRTREDVRIIRGEVARCRSILDQMAGGAGKSEAQRAESVTAAELVALARENIRERPEVRVEMAPLCAKARLHLPPAAVAQALRSLITNAQDASAPTQPVWLHLSLGDSALLVEVRDQGAGMSESELSRAGEPFYTSKEPGRGMGLGLYLARAVVERLGGRLDLHSELREGTRVLVSLPLGHTQSEESRPAPSIQFEDAYATLHPDRR